MILIKKRDSKVVIIRHLADFFNTLGKSHLSEVSVDFHLSTREFKSMAAFKSHYNLCPLLGGNHKLVGISPDKEEDTVLVTLGPNIVAKHKVIRYIGFK